MGSSTANCYRRWFGLNGLSYERFSHSLPYYYYMTSYYWLVIWKIDGDQSRWRITLALVVTVHDWLVFRKEEKRLPVTNMWQNSFDDFLSSLRVPPVASSSIMNRFWLRNQQKRLLIFSADLKMRQIWFDYS